jgi:hypothetical protein
MNRYKLYLFKLWCSVFARWAFFFFGEKLHSSIWSLCNFLYRTKTKNKLHSFNICRYKPHSTSFTEMRIDSSRRYCWRNGRKYHFHIAFVFMLKDNEQDWSLWWSAAQWALSGSAGAPTQQPQCKEYRKSPEFPEFRFSSSIYSPFRKWGHSVHTWLGTGPYIQHTEKKRKERRQTMRDGRKERGNFEWWKKGRERTKGRRIKPGNRIFISWFMVFVSSEYRIGNDVDESDTGLIWGTNLIFSWRNWRRSRNTSVSTFGAPAARYFLNIISKA